MLTPAQLLNLFGGDDDPKKPALAPADATAVARNKGLKPASPEEALARPREAAFKQHRDSLYEKFGTGASEHQDPMYSADKLASGSPLFEPITGFENSPRGRQVDSAYMDVSNRAEDAANTRQNADRVLAQILQEAQKQSGQRKVP